MLQEKQKSNEIFSLYSDNDRSLLRQQPRACALQAYTPLEQCNTSIIAKV